MVLTRLYFSVTTPAAGSDLQVDVEDEGTSLLNAVAAFQTNNAEISTGGFASAANSYTLTKGDLLTIDIDQIGSTTAGAGLKVFFFGYRT